MPSKLAVLLVLAILASIVIAFMAGMWFARLSSELSPGICTFEGPSGDYRVKIEVLSVMRGTSAEETVREANTFNRGAPAGYEYLLVRVRVTLVEGPSGFPP